MRHWKSVTVAALALAAALAAFPQANTGLPPGGKGTKPTPEELAADAALRDSLAGTEKRTWVRKTPEATAMLTFYADGTFESLIIYGYSDLMAKGSQTHCKGHWTVSGKRFMATGRLCDTGKTLKDESPDFGGEVVSVSADALTLKFDSGSTFEFSALH